ncbi:hypothetical protein ILYODFUR_010873 [Ilyodon furcidens]|uniref:Uncharacterized protein n=1 Tax=Ilyodon furcidens TaxID=33524 RepID=A0ABV0TXT3_9TELE
MVQNWTPSKFGPAANGADASGPFLLFFNDKFMSFQVKNASHKTKYFLIRHFGLHFNSIASRAKTNLGRVHSLNLAKYNRSLHRKFWFLLSGTKILTPESGKLQVFQPHNNLLFSLFQ